MNFYENSCCENAEAFVKNGRSGFENELKKMGRFKNSPTILFSFFSFNAFPETVILAKSVKGEK